MEQLRNIRFVTCADGSYRKISPSEIARRGLVLEGVDGDEATNTVTYWYVRRTEA